MPLGADDHRDRRRAEQPVVAGVPPHALEQRVARRGETGHVRDCRPGDEGAGAVERQPEQLDDPAHRDLLDPRAGRTGDAERAVLLPRCEQPVRRDRRGERPAVDEAEVARPRDGDRRGLTDAIELLDHGRGWNRGVLQRDVEGVERGEGLLGRRDATLPHPVQVASRALGDVGKYLPGHFLLPERLL